MSIKVNEREVSVGADGSSLTGCGRVHELFVPWRSSPGAGLFTGPL